MNKLPPVVKQSFCEKPPTDSPLWELIPGCTCDKEYNPEGNGWCGYYAIAFALLFPSNYKLANLCPITIRDLLATKFNEMKWLLQDCYFLDLETLEETLTTNPKAQSEDWWCTFEVFLFAAIVFQESILFKNGTEQENDGTTIKPLLISIKQQPAKYLFYYEGGVHYRVYELTSIPESYEPTNFPFQDILDDLCAKLE